MSGETTAWLAQQLPAMEAALEALVNLNSFTRNREGGQAVGELVSLVFMLPGLRCERVPSQTFADHLVFKSDGRAGEAPVALLGHLDTVFPPGTFEGYRADGVLRRGPGVLDMKGGLVVMAWALKAVAQVKPLEQLPPLRIVVVSDEEVGSPEGAPLIRRVIAGARAALVFESGRANDAIVTSRKGTANAHCRAQGKAAHSGNAHKEGANAIWALARFVDQVQQLTDYGKGITVNVGVVSGGTSKNTVPAQAQAELDLRFETAADRRALVQGLEAAAKSASASVAGTSLALDVSAGRLPLEATEASRALMAQYAAFAKAHGLGADEAPLQGGGSDGNTAGAMGIATIDALGPRGKGFHTHDEYIEVGTLVQRAAALADLLLSL